TIRSARPAAAAPGPPCARTRTGAGATGPAASAGRRGVCPALRVLRGAHAIARFVGAMFRETLCERNLELSLRLRAVVEVRKRDARQPPSDRPLDVAQVRFLVG